MVIYITLLLLVQSLFSQTSPKQPETYINDFSRLNNTKIDQLVTPTNYQELQDIVAYAKQRNLKISVAGTRHSQGGHICCPNGIVVNLQKMNKVLYCNPKKKRVTVQTGITWKEIQEYIQPYNLAVKIMQFANLFTVGGALSVNCNGIDPNYGPLIESVRSIKILTADGSLITASRTENADLFYLTIGGYGLFGIIVEATLDLVEDSLYQRETNTCSLSEYVKQVKKICTSHDLGFHFAFLKLSLTGTKLFSDVVSFNFKKIDDAQFSEKQKKKAKKLHHERFVKFQKLSTAAWHKSRLMKALHWIPESIKHGQIISRNNIMRPPASHLYVELPKETNILQEYFIPVDNLVIFIESLEWITKKLNQNLMHVAFRYIPANNEAALSYTKSDCIGIVLFFNQPMNAQGNAITKKWTKHLIDTAIQCNGAYYLPIQLHADKQQLMQVYPNIDDVFHLKRQYDPDELFSNHFYATYA